MSEKPRHPAPERAAVWLAVAAVTVLAWGYLWRMAAPMEKTMAGMSNMVMPRAEPWGIADFATTFAMWAIMMAGMMLPGAAPTIALFASLDRRRHSSVRLASATIAFVAGYLAVWTAFSVIATLLQAALGGALLLTMAQASASSLLAGGFLVLAGLYQLTPAKRACLRQCRSPLGFFMAYWRDGRWGAFRMGARHGAWCFGCCGFLMLLLFVGGVMNLVWVAALAALTMLEKLVPGGERLAQGVGLFLLAAGTWAAAQAVAT